MKEFYAAVDKKSLNKGQLKPLTQNVCKETFSCIWFWTLIHSINVEQVSNKLSFETKILETIPSSKQHQIGVKNPPLSSWGNLSLFFWKIVKSSLARLGHFFGSSDISFVQSLHFAKYVHFSQEVHWKWGVWLIY